MSVVVIPNRKKQNKQKVNPHCPVSGCETAHPHQDDVVVKRIITEFATPHKLLTLVLRAIKQIRESMVRDIEQRQFYAWHSRLRQADELYFRVLYLLFCAPDEDVPHILSGCYPNSISPQYQKVNRAIFGGKGTLLRRQTTPNGVEFTVMENIHGAAHLSFQALVQCEELTRSPDSLMPSILAHVSHLDTLCEYVNYMIKMFANGRIKDDVKLGVINLHLSR